MAAAVNSDRGIRALSVIGNERSIGEIAQDLYKMWESAGRLVPEKAALGDRVLFRLAKAFFHDNMVLRSGSPEDDLVQEQYDQLQRRYLLTEPEGVRELISAIRHQHLLKAVPDGEEVLPRSGMVKVSGLAYAPLIVRVELPPASLDAHRRDVLLTVVQGDERLLGSLPVADVVGYRKQEHSLAALAPLHRWSRRPGQAVQVAYGDWFTADGYGRELAAAAIAGLVVRRGEAANGMGGTSPLFALTNAGRRWLLNRPSLEAAFQHFNRIEEHTAWLRGESGQVAFDTSTGAILGRYGGQDPRPSHVDVSQMNGEACAGRFYEATGLTLYSEDGLYQQPESDGLRPA
ncbi:hypothetical protein KWH04_17830 [Xanthomonas campestris pv. trichodesmae]|uniref:hypothetical protein n=1 Tax=Xanthomonas citri TaxID=346 RepID=UPI001ABF9899|nr:hypothetical protein [Xanthomonas citri]MBV6782467.1 hypothetical protein [Xanthomonas campestris pv. trichodesmae]